MTLRESCYALEQIDKGSSKRNQWTRVLLATSIWSFIFIFTVFFVLHIILPDLEVSLVVCKSGPVQALKLSRLGKIVNFYAGIPYAKPPIEDRRFRPPEPVEPWSKVLTSDPNRPSCYQHDLMSWTQQFPHLTKKQSEDCLYLNIYVPSDGLSKSLPVLVWFHGGGFNIGSANWYDGSILAVMENIVVVTVSYRLGIFGFLASDSPQIPGNMGLFDQRLALKWIKTNIADFGGDPNKVAVSGEASGSIAIGFHLLTPESYRLFKRAILYSGGPLSPITMFRNRDQENLQTVVNLTNCTESGFIDTSAVTKADLHQQIRCLKRLNAEELVKAAAQVARRNRSGFVPTIHGNFFAKHPYDSVENHEFGPQTELLIGADEDNVLLQVHGYLDRLPGLKIGSNVTAIDLVRRLQMLNPNYDAKSYRILVDMVMRDDKTLSRENMLSRFIHLYNDFVFRCPDYFFIKSFLESDMENQTRKVYYFQHTRSISKIIRKWAQNEAFFAGLSRNIFGYPLMNAKTSDRREVEFTLKIMKIWSSFIRNGNPAPDGSWPSCSTEQLNYLNFDIESTKLFIGFPTKDCEERIAGVYSYGRSSYDE